MKKQEQQKSAWKSSAAMAAYFVVGLLAVMGITAYAMLGNSNSESAQQAGSTVKATGGPAQEIRMAVEATGYEPSTLTVKAGQPVRWTVDGTNAQGCTKYLLAQKIGVSKSLAKGENIIEFTPTEKGAISFQCSMGMVRGTINVV